MHATVRQDRMADSGRAIRGTSVVPKLLAILAAMIVARHVIGAKRQHGGPSHWSRRREAIAEFHRDLHAGDSAPTAGSTGRGAEAADKA